MLIPIIGNHWKLSRRIARHDTWLVTVQPAELLQLSCKSQKTRCKQRGIQLAALQSSGVFDPRGSRKISMQAWLLGSLLAGIKSSEAISEILFTALLDLLLSFFDHANTGSAFSMITLISSMSLPVANAICSNVKLF